MQMNIWRRRLRRWRSNELVALHLPRLASVTCLLNWVFFLLAFYVDVNSTFDFSTSIDWLMIRSWFGQDSFVTLVGLWRILFRIESRWCCCRCRWNRSEEGGMRTSNEKQKRCRKGTRRDVWIMEPQSICSSFVSASSASLFFICAQSIYVAVIHRLFSSCTMILPASPRIRGHPRGSGRIPTVPPLFTLRFNDVPRFFRPLWDSLK